MKNFVLYIICSVFLLGSSYAAKESAFPKLLTEVEALYKTKRSFVAKFEQTKTIAAFNRKKKSNGVIWLRLPNDFRWETYEPDPNIMVSNGKTFWHYSPPLDKNDRGQVVIRSSSQIQSRFARALLAGEFSRTRGVSVEPLEEGRFRLTPKKGSAGSVVEAMIQVDPKKKQITQVVLKHKGGNLTEISLSDIELGKPMTDQMFHFKKPKNTDVIRETPRKKGK